MSGMASAPTSSKTQVPRPTRTKQQTKKQARLPEGTRIQKNPLPQRVPSTRSSQRIYVSPSTPFPSITSRVRKQLNKNLRTVSSAVPQSLTNKLATKTNLSLESRVKAIQQQTEKSVRGESGSGLGLENAGEVVVLGTGKAIEKVLNVAAFFQKQNDCIVQLRTKSLGAVDEVVSTAEDGEDFETGESRIRMVSCLEVSIKLR